MKLLKSQLPLVTSIDRLKIKVFATERATLTPGAVQSQTQVLNEYFEKFLSNYLELVGKNTLANEAYFVEKQFDSTEAAFIETLSYLYDEEARFGSSAAFPVPLTTGSRATTSTHFLRINLPVFSGLQKDWKPFRDLYSSMEAKRILYSVCHRMERDPPLREEYMRFMSDYEKLGHMCLLPPSEVLTGTQLTYYIPHHAVWRNAYSNEKLRVVFNASQRTTSGMALNHLLYTGSKLQNDLAVVLMRWQLSRIGFCADIEMMYRQIRVDDKDVDFQRIVWSKLGSQDVGHYQLLTLVYGMSCSLYLAIRTLRQLATDEANRYPDAAEIIRRNIYVDDILSGTPYEISTVKLRNQFIQLMSSGGMHLKKWASNYSSLLNGILESDRLRPRWEHSETDGPINALGVVWDPVSDEFWFMASAMEYDDSTTKRKVLAAISRLFVPVGWLSPITMVAKNLLLDLLKADVGWDTRLPKHFLRRWTTFQAHIPGITAIRYSRWLGCHPDDRIELHDFSDASKHAYAAVVYLRLQTSDESYSARLMTSKRCVALVKTITIHKLELCAAVLVVRLLNSLREELRLSSWDSLGLGPKCLIGLAKRFEFAANRGSFSLACLRH